MLTLTYNGNDIPLDEGFSVRMSWNNPVCFFDQIPGDAGLGIDIPVNVFSRAYFGHPDRFEKLRATASSRKFQNVELRFDGFLLMCGTLNITNATWETYSGWLQSNVGVIGEQQQERDLTDMEWPEDIAFSNKAIFEEDVDHYCAPQLKNGIWWEEKGGLTKLPRAYYDEDGKYNEADTEIGKLTWDQITNYKRFVNHRPYGVVEYSLKGAVVTPMLWLTYVIDQVFKMNSFFIEANPFRNVIDLTGMVVYNSWSLIRINPVFETQSHQVFNEEYVPDTPLPVGIDLPIAETNEFWREEVTQTIINFQFYLGNINYADLLPQISMKDFMLALQNYFNVAFFWRTDQRVDIIMREHVLEGKVWDIVSETYVTVATFDLTDYFSGNWIIGDQKDVTLKFVQEYDREDRMFGQEFHDLTERIGDFAAAVETFAELELITTDREGTLRLVRSENKIYEWKWSVEVLKDINQQENQVDVMKWEFVSTGPQPYLFGSGDEQEEVKSKLSTLIKLGDDAIALQKGNMASTRSLWNEFSFRVGFASAINGYKLTPVNPISSATLNWEGDDGIFTKRWKTWSRFWSTRLPVEGEFYLPLNVLYFVSNNIHRKFRTEHGEFIIESMETEIGLNLIGKTRIKGYKL